MGKLNNRGKEAAEHATNVVKETAFEIGHLDTEAAHKGQQVIAETDKDERAGRCIPAAEVLASLRRT